MKKAIDSINFLLFDALKGDLRNSPASRQFIAVLAVLFGITFFAMIFLPWWQPRPIPAWAIALSEGVGIGVMALTIRHYRRE